MPRCKTAATLKMSCIMTIAKRFESYWCTGTNALLFDTPRLLYVIGPFECLGSDLIEELLRTMVRLKVLRRHHLHLLIQPHLERLNLAVCDALANHNSVIDTIRNRCQLLTSLSLEGLNKVSPKAISNLLSGLPSLKSLNLKNTKCNDLVLAVMAEQCPLLVDLGLSGCPVTDVGLSRLCLGDDNEGCANLVRLDVECNQVTTDSVAELISRLPRLQWLQFPDLCYSLEILHRNTFLSGAENQHEQHMHHLKLLTGKGLRCDSMSECSVEIACACCPSVVEVQLLQYVTNAHLHHLKALKHLKMMEIGCQYGSVTFREGIAPLLSTLGTSLTSLSLHDLTNPDFSFIGQSCPNLRKFTCSFHDTYGQLTDYLITEETSKPFSNLEELFVIFPSGEVRDTTPESVMLLLLTNSERLRSVQLFNAHCLTDAVIFHVSEKTGFPFLESIVLVGCDRVSATAVSKLLVCDNPLRNVTLDRCRMISIREVDKLRSWCQRNNLDIEISWV